MNRFDQALEGQKTKNLLIVLSGPSCSGKDSVMRQLLKKNGNKKRLVTTNSRMKRADEKEGVDYFFVSKKEFEKIIADEGFYEWVEYRGTYRGTQKKHVQQALATGKDVIWRIDVRGVKNVYERVKKEVPNSVFIFLAESLAILEQRMKKRATETKKEFDWSLNRARWELNQYHNFDYLVHNLQGKLNQAVEQVAHIIEGEKLKLE